MNYNEEANKILLNMGVLATKEDLRPLIGIFDTITKILKELESRIKKLEEEK